MSSSKRQIQYGTASFEAMIKNKYLYIDKTERIYDLVSLKNGERFFLSRPRRFGKTLLVDIMEQIFKGNKELFKGLAIYDKDYDWKKFPVIRINLSDCDSRSSEELEEFLCELTEDIASDFDIDLSKVKTRTPRSYLSFLFKSFKNKKQKVVVLVDEYDYPVIKNIIDSETADAFRETLKNFYAVLKANTNSIHFEFLTGVTKLAYTTIFSGVNDVEDISANEDFSDLLGYRQDEVEKYFSSEIEREHKLKGVSKERFLDQIKEWYDGYRFSDKDLKVYNPSSINKFFKDKCKFDVYWISTATPEFLVKLLSRNSDFDIDEEFSHRISNFFVANKLDVLHFERTNLIYLLYQTGYVTVKDIDENGDYALGYPNKEVGISFVKYLAQAYLGLSTDSVFNRYRPTAVRSLIEGNIEGFIQEFNRFLKSVPSTPQEYRENAFQLGMAAILYEGSDVLEFRSEEISYKGRSDVVVITKKYVYIIELKLDTVASKGMDQIKDKKYFYPYLNNESYKDKSIVLISISFSAKTKEVKDYIVETIR